MAIVRIEIDLVMLRSTNTKHAAQTPLLLQAARSLIDSVDLAKPEGVAFKKRLATATTCTVVTNPCGSCQENGEDGALLEMFCDDDDESGHYPTYTQCESC